MRAADGVAMRPDLVGAVIMIVGAVLVVAALYWLGSGL